MTVGKTYYPNISCPVCKHRHPLALTCEEAREVAEVQRPEPTAAPLGEGQENIPLPSSAGRIISMVTFQDQLYVAFEYGLYRKTNNPAINSGWEQILP